MDIAEVARRTGFPASTLRFYDEKGLISSQGRQGLRRSFSPDVIDRLALIALGQAAGFSLDEIRGMFGTRGEPHIDRQALTAKASELDRTIVRLRAMSRGLRHAAACRAPSHAECPTFRRLMKSAALGALESRRKPGRPGSTTPDLFPHSGRETTPAHRATSRSRR